MASHNDGAYQEFKTMYERETEKSDNFLRYVQTQQLIRIANYLEKIAVKLDDIESSIARAENKLSNGV